MFLDASAPWDSVLESPPERVVAMSAVSLGAVIQNGSGTLVRGVSRTVLDMPTAGPHRYPTAYRQSKSCARQETSPPSALGVICAQARNRPSPYRAYTHTTP